MAFNFNILNKSNPYSIYSGGSINLQLHINDPAFVMQVPISFTYKIVGSGVNFKGGNVTRVSNFTHSTSVETFNDQITLVSTDGASHTVGVSVIATINGVQQLDAITVLVH
jgi:putative lipoic acid-binding regulatory protein